ncbi:MAG: YbfB/YjiJ family MFS transporter, partial [Proteobacteria bacterium]
SRLLGVAQTSEFRRDAGNEHFERPLGALSAASGSDWATANYAGYLFGALTAARFSADPRRGLQFALYGIAITTLSISWIGNGASALLGPTLRGASGVFSAWALVCASSWGLAELARRQARHLGALIYTGVGIGIAAAGTLPWFGGQQPARWLWLEMGLLACAGAGLVTMGMQRLTKASTARKVLPSLPLPDACRHGHLTLVLCYGVSGFGYIVPATYLPAMARQQIADPMIFGLIWPLFGLMATVSVMLSAHYLAAWSRERVWALAQGIMALGTALLVMTTSLWALAASAVLIGGTFMIVTMAGFQLARDRVPENPTPLLARMTVAFASGQILGPLSVRMLSNRTAGGTDALAWTHTAATMLLLSTALWLWKQNASTSPIKS